MAVANVYGQSARWLVPLLYLFSAAAFVADIKRDNALAYGVIYIPLVATALFHRRRAGLWILTAATCLLAIVGAFVPAVNPDLPDVVGNRILSIMAILATAAFVHHARAILDRLAAQTSRAEAAERIKSEIFANLSCEIAYAAAYPAEPVESDDGGLPPRPTPGAGTCTRWRAAIAGHDRQSDRPDPDRCPPAAA
jgi:uncharacterized membrane protein YfcA